MITLDKVKIIREGRKKKVNNPGQGDLFDKGRPAQRQNPSTKKSVDQVKSDIEFQQNLKKAGASGDVSDKAGPEIRKRVETVRKTRADKLGTPDPFTTPSPKTEIKPFGSKPVTTSAPGFGKGTGTDSTKLKRERIPSDTGSLKDVPKVKKRFSQMSQDIKGLKVNTDIDNFIKKVDKKNNPLKPSTNPDFTQRRAMGAGGSDSNFTSAEPLPKPKGVNQSDISKKQKAFTDKVNKVRKSKLLGPDGKPLFKSTSRPPQTRYNPTEPFMDDDLGQRTGKTGDKLVNKPQNRAPINKPSMILDKSGNPITKPVDSTIAKKIPKSQRTYTQSNLNDILKKAKAQYRTTVDSGKEAIRQTNQTAYNQAKKFKDAAELRNKQNVFDTSKKSYAKGTEDTLDAARRAQKSNTSSGFGKGTSKVTTSVNLGNLRDTAKFQRRATRVSRGFGGNKGTRSVLGKLAKVVARNPGKTALIATGALATNYLLTQRRDSKIRAANQRILNNPNTYKLSLSDTTFKPKEKGKKITVGK
tara:strand:+ start:386 stop:1963 length:1578 start_codon:yes stop_codon:yes gene_type:complete